MRKRIVVDKGLQVKTTLVAVSAVLVILVVIMTAVGVIVRKNDSVVDLTVSKLGDTIVDQNHAIESLQDFSSIKNGDEQRIASRILSDNLKENNYLLEKNIQLLKGISWTNRMLFWILFVFIVIQICVLYVVMLRWTLRIAGPVHLMVNNLKSILKTGEGDFRDIRSNDELQELYSLVRELAARYKDSSKIQ